MSMTNLTLDNIEAMVRSILSTKDEEIGCADCFSVLDRFLELKLAGKDASAIMPLVQDHLERCGDCHEEYVAVMEALHAISSSPET
jgi:hypothetical protein